MEKYKTIGNSGLTRENVFKKQHDLLLHSSQWK